MATVCAYAPRLPKVAQAEPSLSRPWPGWVVWPSPVITVPADAGTPDSLAPVHPRFRASGTPAVQTGARPDVVPLLAWTICNVGTGWACAETASAAAIATAKNETRRVGPSGRRAGS